MAWLTSAISVGVATGSAIAGHVIDAGGAALGLRVRGRAAAPRPC